MKETTPSHSFLLNTEVHAVWGCFLALLKNTVMLKERQMMKGNVKRRLQEDG